MNTKKKRTTSLPPHNSTAKITKNPRYTKSEAVKLLENIADEDARKYQLSIVHVSDVYVLATSFGQFYKWFNSNYGRVNHER